jgi:hypothetical protein
MHLKCCLIYTARCRYFSQNQSAKVSQLEQWLSVKPVKEIDRLPYSYSARQSRYSNTQRPGLPGFDSRQGQEIFRFSAASRLTLGTTQPPIQLEPGALSSEVKRPGREPGYSPPSSAKVRNGGAIPPHSHKFTKPDTHTGLQLVLFCKASYGDVLEVLGSIFRRTPTTLRSIVNFLSPFRRVPG